MIKKVSRAELNSSLENLKDVLGHPNPTRTFAGTVTGYLEATGPGLPKVAVTIKQFGK